MTNEELQNFIYLNGKMQSFLISVALHIAHESEVPYMGYSTGFGWFVLQFEYEQTIWGQYPYLMDKNWILNQIDYLTMVKATHAQDVSLLT